MRAVRIVAVLLILVHDNQLSWPNILIRRDSGRPGR